jgi:hypothetical protein
MSRTSRPMLAVGLALVAIVSCSCGVGAQSEPRVIGAAEVPQDLLAPGSTTTSTTAPQPGTTIVYFEGLQRLVAVRRGIHGPVTAGAALAQLATGPTLLESRQGLTSPVSSAAPFDVSPVSAGIVDVGVGASFTSLAGASQIVAAAQLVYTATAVAGVRGVILSVGGQPTQVPTADGSLSAGPLTRADYSAIGPRPPDPG